jgi:hypothetical protein
MVITDFFFDLTLERVDLRISRDDLLRDGCLSIGQNLACSRSLPFYEVSHRFNLAGDFFEIGVERFSGVLVHVFLARLDDGHMTTRDKKRGRLYSFG